MKLLLPLSFLLPPAVAAQTGNDYQRVMAKFQQYYNAGQGDSIHAMFSPTYQAAVAGSPLWTNKHTAASLQKFGTLKSFQFIGVDNTDPDKVLVFQTFFSKAGAQTTSLTLHQDKNLGTFRFMTTSPSIDHLLKKRKTSRK